MSEIYRITVPCHFGMEAVLKREIYDLGYEVDSTDNGKVTFLGDAEAVVRANIFLSTTERVLINVSEFTAVTFEELFQNIKSCEWEKYIPPDGKFWVAKATSINSKLFSAKDIQSVVKKAIVERLKEKYHIDWFKEDGPEYPIRINILKDKVMVGLDSSGVSLHKRGYRPKSGIAPISETLAASIINLTPWNKDRILVDPFCGSGTFAIEAAMKAAGIAPGLNREFTAMKWDNIISSKEWNDIRQEAKELVNTDIETDIQAYDIDENVLKTARDSARNAGVEKLIHFQKRDVKDLKHGKKYGFIITNPPYGERLEEKENLPKLYGTFGECFKSLSDWSAYVITPYGDIEKDFGRKATKKRKIYNGMIKTDLYSFEGAKPPKRSRDAGDKQ